MPEIPEFQLIPAIDIRGGQCVRLRQGDYAQETVFADDPVQMARHWAEQGATRLHLVDLDGAKQGRPVNHELVARIVRELDIPCQLGGGIRDDDAAETLLGDVQIDRIIIGTQAIKQPDWFQRLAERYPHRIVLGLDARGTQVAAEGWLEDSELSVAGLAQRYAALPLAAVIYTNIAQDGMMAGIGDASLETLAQLCGTGLSIIASGGVTNMDDVQRLLELRQTHSNLAGAIVGRSLYEGVIDLAQAMETIKSH